MKPSPRHHRGSCTPSTPRHVFLRLGILLVCGTATTSLLGARIAHAQTPGPVVATQPPPTTSAPAANATATAAPIVAPPSTTAWATCKENLPEGKARPNVEEKFPAQSLAGHAAVLEVTLTHGKGERVLADAFELQRDSDGAKALRQSGFEFPSTSGPGAPQVVRTERESDAVTVVKLAVVPLPKESGAHPVTLPPLPIAIARASSEVMTLCTSPHDVTVTDPLANVPNAEPKRHPGGERQRELWVAMRNVTYGALLGLLLAGVIALLVRWFRRRPKVLPPPPPPRPAWEIALAALTDIRHSDLLTRGQFTSHLERVNHVLRQYLGGRYGFDGLESTTEEVLTALEASPLPKELFTQTRQMLHDSDLVKFAKLVPTEAQCKTALDDVESLVRKTMHETDVTDLNERPQPSVGVGSPIRGVGHVHPPGTIAEVPARQPAASSATLGDTNETTSGPSEPKEGAS